MESCGYAYEDFPKENQTQKTCNDHRIKLKTANFIYWFVLSYLFLLTIITPIIEAKTPPNTKPDNAIIKVPIDSPPV